MNNALTISGGLSITISVSKVDDDGHFEVEIFINFGVVK
jgi:hypothetical protein